MSSRVKITFWWSIGPCKNVWLWVSVKLSRTCCWRDSLMFQHVKWTNEWFWVLYWMFLYLNCRNCNTLKLDIITVKQSLKHCEESLSSCINNCLPIRRLSAWDIQELPLLAASSQMETAPMAGKSRQPSQEPPRGGRKQVHVTLIKQWN